MMVHGAKGRGDLTFETLSLLQYFRGTGGTNAKVCSPHCQQKSRSCDARNGYYPKRWAIRRFDGKLLYLYSGSAVRDDSNG
jgi:hypothetical protein